MVAIGFFILPVLLSLALAVAVGRAGGSVLKVGLGLAAWLALTGALAAHGTLASFASFPPPLLRLVLVGNLLVTVLALTTRLRWSLAGLIAFQGFRLPLELLMHQAYQEGIMPGQMTWTGRNFDVLTGASALVVAWLVAHGAAGKRTALVWNLAGLGLLVNVVTVAIQSFPGPLQSLWPSNTWVTGLPYVWLPTVMVPLALGGHLLVFRRLYRYESAAGTQRAAGQLHEAK